MRTVRIPKDQRTIYYACDHTKNTGCKKNMCYYKEDAVYRICVATRNPEFAKLDRKGRPIKRNPQTTLREHLKAEPIRWTEIAIPAATAAITSLLLLWLQGK